MTCLVCSLAVQLPCHQEALKRSRPPCVDLFICVWIKACIPDKGDVRGALTATEAAECVRFGRCAGRNKECRWHLWSLDRREPLSIPLILPSPQKGAQAGRFWAHTAPCLPYSLNDTNHSATTHDSISSGIMCGGCLLQTLRRLSALSRLETARAENMNTRGFSYWLDGMPVRGAYCLIVLIVFKSPPKANTKNLPCMIVWKSDQWGEGYVSHLKAVSASSVFILLIMTLELFPLLIPHTHDIASSHKDKSLQRQCQGGAAIGCEGLPCITLHSILSVFSHQRWFFFFPYQFSSSFSITSRTVTEQKYRQSGIWGAVVAEDWRCWTGEGIGVNYSITGWLS